jgi:hypothetical protein
MEVNYMAVGELVDWYIEERCTGRYREKVRSEDGNKQTGSIIAAKTEQRMQCPESTLSSPRASTQQPIMIK